MFGRFHSVSSSVASACTYGYLDGSDLVSGMTASSGFLWTRAYESGRSLITAVENRYGETVISRYDYANDALGRRVSRADSGLAFSNPAFDAYSYNSRSEVTGARRYHGTDVSDTSTVYGGRQFGYAYDPIGNRISASETIGGETLSKAYTANALNQYTAIANPDAVGLRGDATNTAAVTVNGEAVQSDGITSDTIPWHFALEADNGSGPDFPYAEIVAVVNPPGTNTPDIVSTTTGHLYAPPQNETLTYDDDGNLLADGRWHYTWNGENRLVKAEEQVSPTNREPYTVEYAYDHQGRMVWKQVSTNAVVLSTRTLLWDGWNIVRETVAIGNQQSSITNSYVWGLDLSGTLQGAGGIGGLLAEVRDGAFYTATYDANGNVTEYLSANGTLAAHYEYDPFGNTVVQSGPMADSFTHRFSTKPWCAVTGLSEYLFRKYSPGMGRWLSRDPIGEDGGINLYAAIHNDPVSLRDILGLITYSYMSRGSYGETIPNIGRPSCVKIGLCKWILQGGTANPQIKVFEETKYLVKGSDGRTYGATCKRLQVGMGATRAHEEQHAKNILDGVQAANQASGLPISCISELTCNWKRKGILPAWNASVAKVLENESGHGPGAPTPTAQTFNEEYSAGNCAFTLIF